MEQGNTQNAMGTARITTYQELLEASDVDAIHNALCRRYCQHALRLVDSVYRAAGFPVRGGMAT